MKNSVSPGFVPGTVANSTAIPQQSANVVNTRTGLRRNDRGLVELVEPKERVR